MVLVLQLNGGSWFRGSVEKFCRNNPIFLTYFDIVSSTVIRIKPSLKEINIGRDDNKNQIVLDDSRVSRIHAAIIRVHRMWCITDRKSKNGTFINGEPVTDAVSLKADDKLVLGVL